MKKELLKNKVRDIRKEKGVTQAELASAVNVSRQTIISIEKGNYVPSVFLALKISGFFDKNLEDVFKIIEE